VKTKDLKQISGSINSILSRLDSQDEVFDFLTDLLTAGEIVEFSRRFQVAQMLENNVKYTEIEAKTGMSSTTIARISKFLNSETGGYKNAISTLKSITDRHHTGHQI